MDMTSLKYNVRSNECLLNIFLSLQKGDYGDVSYDRRKRAYYYYLLYTEKSYLYLSSKYLFIIIFNVNIIIYNI